MKGCTCVCSEGCLHCCHPPHELQKRFKGGQDSQTWLHSVNELKFCILQHSRNMPDTWFWNMMLIHAKNSSHQFISGQQRQNKLMPDKSQGYFEENVVPQMTFFILESIPSPGHQICLKLYYSFAALFLLIIQNMHSSCIAQMSHSVKCLNTSKECP